MRKLRAILIATALTVALPPTTPAFAQGTHDLFQQALRKENVEGDLPAAIDLYRRVVQSSDRELAARALVRIGHSYERLGRDGAEEAYRQVLREYADQQEQVEIAQARLASLGRSRAVAAASLGEPSGTVMRRVWTANQLDIGRISPRGRYVTAEHTGSGDLHGELMVHDLLSGETRRLTHILPAEDVSIDNTRISPDERWVAYSFQNAEGVESLRIVGVDGSEPRVLSSNPEVRQIEPESWSPDSRRILARLQRIDGTWQIAWVDPADGSVQVLKSVGWWDYPEMEVSPDGRWIAYALRPEESTRNEDIFLLAADGSREVRAVRHPADDDLIGWAPDGSKLLFRSDRLGRGADPDCARGCRRDLWALNVADGPPQGDPRLIHVDIGTFFSRGFTSTGAFYYTPTGRTTTQRINTAALDLATGELLHAPTPVSQEFRWAGSPAWSPDGENLAYFYSRGFQIPEILVIRPVEAGEEREIPLPFPALGPRWSPDGRSIHVRYERARRSGIASVDVATGEIATVFEEAVEENSTVQSFTVGWGWSADGNALVLVRHEYGTAERSSSFQFKVIRHEPGTGRKTEVYRRDSHAGFALSSDGRHIALLSQSDSASVIEVVSVADGAVRRLLAANPGELRPTLAWTPDGHRLVFAKAAGAVVQLWAIPAEGGEPRQLGLDIEGWTISTSVAVHPDGRRIAFSAGRNLRDGGQQLWVMENILR